MSLNVTYSLIWTLLRCVLLSVVINFSSFIDGAKILMYVPNISYSHVFFNLKISDILINNGHNVVSY